MYFALNLWLQKKKIVYRIAQELRLNYMEMHTESSRWGCSKISTKKTSEVPSAYTLRRGTHSNCSWRWAQRSMYTLSHDPARTPCVPSIYCVRPPCGVCLFTRLVLSSMSARRSLRREQGCSGERGWWRHLVASQARRQRWDTPRDRGRTEAPDERNKAGEANSSLEYANTIVSERWIDLNEVFHSG